MVRRAQMKIQQMAFMLIAVTLFFVLVGMFVLIIRFAGLKDKATELEERNSMLLVSKLANSPEFSCENAFGFKTDCIDADKVMELSGKPSYNNFWGIAKIEVRKIYPESDITCTSSNYPECGIIEVLSRNVKALEFSSSFVSLCRKEVKEENVIEKCELAKLMIAGEDKT
jgi:hypothetical protein